MELSQFLQAWQKPKPLDFVNLGYNNKYLGCKNPAGRIKVTNETTTHYAPEFKHVSEMEWEMGRFKNKTKFLFHPTPERPTEPNAGILNYEPGASFPLHKHDFAQVWYILEGEFQFGDKLYKPGTFAFMPDPHFEYEMKTETGGKIVFLQYPGPTTGGRPVYAGRMNLKADEVKAYEPADLEH